MPDTIFAPYLDRWHLTQDGAPIVTPAARLLPGRQGGLPAMLKVVTLDEAKAGSALLTWWDGVGAARVYDMDGDAVRALGYDPEERLELGPAGEDGEDVVLATGDLFVTDPVRRDQLALGAHLVDMEGYSVAWAARHFGARVRLAKHVSDAADESALDWNAAVDRSARALGEWLAAQV